MLCQQNFVFLFFFFGFGFSIPPSEMSALRDFYFSTGGPYWTHNDNWLNGDPCQIQWSGIECNFRLTNVASIVRQQQNLSGTLPDSLSNFTELEELFLSYNADLSGTVPPFYIGLKSLSALPFGFNGYTGSIPPNLGSCPSLSSLDFSGQWSGTIPEDTFGIAPYSALTFQAPLGGTFPESFCQNKGPHTLKSLFVRAQQMAGTLPDCFDSNPHMNSLIISGTQISGTIPRSITKLSSLTVLELNFNQLDGTLPELATKSLDILDFQYNQFTGTLPDYSANFRSPKTTSDFEVNNNQLTGTIPDWICDLAGCHLGSNNFECPEPQCCSDSSDYHCGVSCRG